MVEIRTFGNSSSPREGAQTALPEPVRLTYP
jgi:hypothetical protein